jgi:hypothetical protein
MDVDNIVCHCHFHNNLSHHTSLPGKGQEQATFKFFLFFSFLFCNPAMISKIGLCVVDFGRKLRSDEQSMETSQVAEGYCISPALCRFGEQMGLA